MAVRVARTARVWAQPIQRLIGCFISLTAAAVVLAGLVGAREAPAGLVAAIAVGGAAGAYGWGLVRCRVDINGPEILVVNRFRRRALLRSEVREYDFAARPVPPIWRLFLVRDRRCGSLDLADGSSIYLDACDSYRIALVIPVLTEQSARARLRLLGEALDNEPDA